MKFCSAFLYAAPLGFLTLGVAAKAGTTTAPAGLPVQTPPTRTVYAVTATLPSGFPCAGKVLKQAKPKSYPDSLFTTTTTVQNTIDLFTSYSCCTETIVRKAAIPTPPTSTHYLTTVTSTHSTLCGGCEIANERPQDVWAFVESSSYYTATVTKSKTTEVVYECIPGTRTLSVNTAKFSGACTDVSGGPSFPRDFEAACLKNIRGLSGCPWECVIPIGMYPTYSCFAEDITHYFDKFNNQSFPSWECDRCLPPCPAKPSVTSVGYH